MKLTTYLWQLNFRTEPNKSSGRVKSELGFGLIGARLKSTTLMLLRRWASSGFHTVCRWAGARGSLLFNLIVGFDVVANRRARSTLTLDFLAALSIGAIEQAIQQGILSLNL